MRLKKALGRILTTACMSALLFSTPTNPLVDPQLPLFPVQRGQIQPQPLRSLREGGRLVDSLGDVGTLKLCGGLLQGLEPGLRLFLAGTLP